MVTGLGGRGTALAPTGATAARTDSATAGVPIEADAPAQNNLTGHRLVATRTRRYLEAIRWQVRDLVTRDPRRMTIIIGLVTAGRFVQAAAFASVIWYFVAFQKETTLEFAGFVFNPRDSHVMTAAIACVGIVLIFSTVLIYISNRTAYFVSIDFARNVVSSVMSLEGAWPTSRNLAPDRTMSMQAYELCKGRSRMFRSVRTILALPRSMLLFVMAIGGMIWISPSAVGILSILAIPALVLNYMISRSVVVAQRQLKIDGKALTADLKAKMSNLTDETSFQPDRGSTPDRFVQGRAYNKYVATFSTRIISPAKAELVASLLGAVAIAIVGAYLGQKALAGTMPLALVIGFFVALRLAIGGFTGVTVSLTSYARFYAIVRSSFEYLTSPIAKASSFPGRPVVDATNPEHAVTDGLQKDLELKRGVPIAVISPAMLNRFTQYFIVVAVSGKMRPGAQRKLNAATVVCNAALAEPARLEEHGVSSMDNQALSAKVSGTPIHSVAPGQELIRRAAQGDATLSEEDIARIALLSGLMSHADLVIFDVKLLCTLSAEERTAWIEAFADRFMVVAYKLHPFRPLCVGEEFAVLCDFQKVIGVVGKDRVEPSIEEVRALAAKSKVLPEENADDEDEEEFE